MPLDLEKGLGPLGEQKFDAILISGVLHRLGADHCGRLVGELSSLVNPGGTMALIDVMLDQDRTSPRFATLFALNMFLSSKDGGAHSTADHKRWLEDAGMVRCIVRELPPPFPEVLVQGWKP